MSPSPGAAAQDAVLPFPELTAFRRKWLEPALPSPQARAETKAFQPAVLDPRFSAQSGLTFRQILIVLLGAGGTAYWGFQSPSSLCQTVLVSLWLCFVATAGLRLFCSLINPHAADLTTVPSAVNENLPVYSVIVALYKEVAVVPQLVAALRALDYPVDRLDIILALEADDVATQAALEALDLPQHMRLLIVPEGKPKTKPRALNYAFARARGDYVVIYDAEDIPHPHQLREAVGMFSASPRRLACLQAPLRPLGGDSFIARQFAAEYAVQFDVILPAFATLGLPLPLGGTSNHFRIDVLRSIGGWDAWNVTEDADLGMRLGRLGYLSAVLKTPTFESPPANTTIWIPQRTRWIKGYIQTLIVHTRSLSMPSRLWLSLWLGVGLSVLTAIAYGPFTLMVLARFMMSALSHTPADMAWIDLGLFVGGTWAAMMALGEGAKRSQVPFELGDMLLAPFYWGLASISAIFAVVQLLTRPFHWDKTEHTPMTHDQARKVF